MADAILEDPRLARIYDAIDDDRSDLPVYVALVDELGAQVVLDVGCGTRAFACLLAADGRHPIGVNPAAASLDVPRRRPHADRVRWLCGDAARLAPVHVDAVTMTGNVAQLLVTDTEWMAALESARAVLGPGDISSSRHVTRSGAHGGTGPGPTRSAGSRCPGVELVETWAETTDIRPPFISLRHSFEFQADETLATSSSMLRLRERTEIIGSLRAAGSRVIEVRGAPERPDREFVFISECLSPARPRTVSL